MPLKRCRAFELEVRLKTNYSWVCRRLTVPADITFEQLATVIKRAYGWWRRENQFHFLLCNEKGFPALYLREERDPSTFELPAIVMTGIKLSEYIPKYKSLQFLYDYRADWTMLIDLNTVHDSYIGAIPQLEFGEGNAPPEDVGGANGFEEFLDKLEYGKYAERKEAARWGKSYGYAEFDYWKTSRDVENSLKW